MMYNIHTGRGVPARSNDDIIILVSSLHQVQQAGCRFVFSDRHAYTETARFFNDMTQLVEVDWLLLQARNFKRNMDDPEQIERYQAEALIHQHLPVSGLVGIVCYTDTLKSALEQQIKQRNIDLAVHKMPGWYF
jgi:hypothetical protein